MRAAPKKRPGVDASYCRNVDHLTDELAKLDSLLQQRVAAIRERDRMAPGLAASRGVYISDDEVDALLEPERRSDTESSAAVASAGWRALDDRIAARMAASAERGIVLTLPRLAQLFSLSSLETQILVMCLAPELRRTYDTVYAYLQDDVTRKRPSVDLVLQVLCSSEIERWRLRAELLSDQAPLFRHGILRRVEDSFSPSGASGLAQFLRVDERILHYVLGNCALDAQVAGYATLVNPATPLEQVLVDATVKARLLNLFTSLTGSPSVPFVICFSGPSGVGKRDLALGLCAQWGCPLLHLDMELLLAREADVAGALRRAFREGLLLDAPVYVSLGETPVHEAGRPKSWIRVLARMVSEYGGFLFLSGEHPAPPLARAFDGTTCYVVEVPIPDIPLRETAWKRALERIPAERAGPLALELAGQFRLTPAQIASAAESMVQQQAIAGVRAELTAADAYAACRRQSHHALSELAIKVEPKHTWEDLVLPPGQQEQLKDLCRQVLHRHLVLSEWGFERKLARGSGVSALFAGPSGTGKTMAAEVIARELRRDMYRIDLSGVVSKYIGETEKNLSRIFLEAEASNAILFFDEADALFGRRTKVSDAHDRYANIETSYLLQRVEAYEGVVILATNLRENIDEAFTRRITLVVDFPFPDTASRRAIWRTHVPSDAPVAEDVDYDWLSSQLQITGGTIKNIVLAAAFFAAADDGVIGMSHMMRGARREFEKIGKLWIEHGFAPLPR